MNEAKPMLNPLAPVDSPIVIVDHDQDDRLLLRRILDIAVIKHGFSAIADFAVHEQRFQTQRRGAWMKSYEVY